MPESSEVKIFDGSNQISLKKRLEIAGLTDSRVIGLWVASIFVVLLASQLLYGQVLFFGHAISHTLFALPVFFLMFFSATLAILFAIRAMSRIVLSKERKLIAQAEKRINAGTYTDLTDELNTLITENLKMKRYQVAEFYSKQLLAMTEKTIKPEALKATSCWVNSESYQGSFKYNFVWLYEHIGTMSLTSDSFCVQTQKMSFTIPVENLVSVTYGRHPLWIKPIPLKYLIVKFKEKGFEHTYFMTPRYLQTDTVFDVNSYVDEWYGYLTQAISQQKTNNILEKLSACVEESCEEPEDIGQLIEELNNN